MRERSGTRAERAEKSRERRGEWEWRKRAERSAERSAEREVAELESGDHRNMALTRSGKTAHSSSMLWLVHKMWNSLPASPRSVDDYKCFKQLIMANLFDGYCGAYTPLLFKHM